MAKLSDFTDPVKKFTKQPMTVFLAILSALGVGGWLSWRSYLLTDNAGVLIAVFLPGFLLGLTVYSVLARIISIAAGKHKPAGGTNSDRGYDW